MFVLSYEVWREDGGGKSSANKSFDTLSNLLGWARNSRVWKGSVFARGEAVCGIAHLVFLGTVMDSEEVLAAKLAESLPLPKDTSTLTMRP